MDIMKYRINIICLICVLLTVLSACALKNEELNEESDLTEEQMDDLMLQYIEDMECCYDEYLPSIWIASCKIFGVERENNTNIGYIYAYVLDEEYVKFGDAAYEQSGGYCPVKIKVKFDDDNIKYLDREYPEDGDDYQDSMKELFPSKYYSMYEKYDPYDENGNPKLKKQQEEKIKEIWGIHVSKEYSLNISENGSYELVWTTGGGPEEEFEVHVKETGKLEKLVTTE